MRKIDALIKADLTSMLTGKPKLGTLTGLFGTRVGLTFPLTDVVVERKNVTSEMRSDYHGGSKTVPAATLREILVKPSEKSGKGKVDISSQVNFATTAEIYDRMQQLAPPEAAKGHEAAFADLQERLHALLVAAHLRVPMPRGGAKLQIFLRALAKTLSGQLAVPSVTARSTRQKALYAEPSKEERGRLRPKLDSPEGYDRSMASHVKDVGGSWIKDTIWNIGLGLLTPAEWKVVSTIAWDATLKQAVTGLQPKGGVFVGSEQAQYRDAFSAARLGILAALPRIAGESLALSLRGQRELDDMSKGPAKQIEFLGHDARMIGPRQDTYIPSDKVQMPGQWAGSRLHVVETRGGPMRALEWLEADTLMRTTAKTDAEIAEGFSDLEESDVRDMRNRAIRKLAAGNGIPPMARDTIAATLHVLRKRVNEVLD